MTHPQSGMTAGQLIKILSRVPADSVVQIDPVRVGLSGRYAVSEIETEQHMADGPPNGLGGPTVVGTGMWVVVVR